MEITPVVLQVFGFLFWFSITFTSIAFMLNAIERHRDMAQKPMLEMLKNGRTFFAFQRQYCRIHPTENRPL